VPGYIAKAADFKAKGVDDIIVLAVNDCFAMRAWEKTFETDKVRAPPSLPPSLLPILPPSPQRLVAMASASSDPPLHFSRCRFSPLKQNI